MLLLWSHLCCMYSFAFPAGNSNQELADQGRIWLFLGLQLKPLLFSSKMFTTQCGISRQGEYTCLWLTGILGQRCLWRAWGFYWVRHLTFRHFTLNENSVGNWSRTKQPINMHIKTMMKYYLTPVRADNKQQVLVRMQKMGTLMHCWWECKHKWIGVVTM